MDREERRRRIRESGKPVEWVRRENLVGKVCAWRGCGQWCLDNPSDLAELPLGWRYLIVSPVSVLKPDWFNYSDRDAVICPAHFQELDALLMSLV